MLQRDLEGNGIAEAPQETAASQRSTPVAPRAVAVVKGIAPRRPRRLVLVQRSHEKVETAVDEEGFLVNTSGEGVFETIREPDIEIPEVRDSSAAIREGFRHLDDENVSVLFETRANVLKTVPHFLKGPYRTAMRIALTEASCGDKFRRVRGWKLFLLLPRVLLARKPRGNLIREIDQPFLSVLPREVDRIDQSERARCRGCVHGQVPPIKASKCRHRKTGSASTNVGPDGANFLPADRHWKRRRSHQGHSKLCKR